MRSYLRARHMGLAAVAMVVVSAVAALWGTASVTLPSAVGTAPVQIWVYLPASLAALVVGGLHSEMRSLEETDTGILTRAHALHVTCALAGSTVLLGGALLIADNPSVACGAVRNLWFWTGLALISARIWRWSLAWLMPLMALFPFDWFGLEATGPKGWAWPMLPPSNTGSWIATAVVIAIGASVHLLTPWRVQAVTFTRRHAKHS